MGNTLGLETRAVHLVTLLVALEPMALRADIETALVLLGHRAAAVEGAVCSGLVRPHGARLDTDPALARAVVRQTPSRTLRTAHLALSCAGGPSAQETYDRLAAGAVARATSTADTATAIAERLTPQERTVAALAATGPRTADIARAIYVSPRTVEHHLTRVYRKLGVRSKAELACAFRTH